MAIAYDAFSDGGLSSSVTSLSWSHTCTGSNRLLVVGIIGDTTSDKLTGVTYAGVAMTLIAKLQMPSNTWQYLYYLLNPTSGANNIVATGGSTMNVLGGQGVSYTGVKQSSQPDGYTTATPTATSCVTTITTTADNCWAVTMGRCTGVAPSTTATGGVNRGVSSYQGMFDSNGVIHPAGSFSMTIFPNGGGTQTFCDLMATFAPVVTSSFTATESDSMMNAASRLATVGRVFVGARAISASMMNAASRFAIVGKGIFRTMSDSIMNAASRFASVSAVVHHITAYVASISDSMMNARNRYAIAKAYVNGLLIQFTSKFTSRGTTFGSKYTPQGTDYEDKYH